MSSARGKPQYLPNDVLVPIVGECVTDEHQIAEALWSVEYGVERECDPSDYQGRWPSYEVSRFKIGNDNFDRV